MMNGSIGQSTASNSQVQLHWIISDPCDPFQVRNPGPLEDAYDALRWVAEGRALKRILFGSVWTLEQVMFVSMFRLFAAARLNAGLVAYIV